MRSKSLIGGWRANIIPDVNPGDKASEERFKSVQEAYDILSDAKKRQVYDQYGFYSDNIPTGAGAGAGPGSQPNMNFDGFDFSDYVHGPGRRASTGSGAGGGGMGGFRDIFSNLFNRGEGAPAGAGEGRRSRILAEYRLLAGHPRGRRRGSISRVMTPAQPATEAVRPAARPSLARNAMGPARFPRWPAPCASI